MTEVIYRYEIPVDDHWHDLELSGEIVHVAARRPEVVELWALHSGGVTSRRRFRAVGTGHPLPDADVAFRGTALIGPLVWHLVELLAFAGGADRG